MKCNIIKVGNTNVMEMNWNDQRVLTTPQLAEVYRTDPNNVYVNFKRNKDKFEEGVHYISLSGQELKAFKRFLTESKVPWADALKYAPQLYLWTHRGASRHCKMLDTDKAWEQFDRLEESYFSQHKQLSQLEIIQQSLEVLTRHDDEIAFLKDKTSELERKIDVIGAYENSMQYKQLCKLCSARVKELLNYQVYFCLWSPFFYKTIHSQLSREFLVASTKLIKTQDLEAAKKLIRNWFPSDYYIKSKTDELVEKRDAGVLKENRIMALHIWLNDSNDGNDNLFGGGH